MESARYTDPRTVAYLTETLIGRRDKIARAWLTVVNPVVDPILTDEALTFDNAAVRAGVAEAPAGYEAEWHTFDNATGLGGGVERRLGDVR